VSEEVVELLLVVVIPVPGCAWVAVRLLDPRRCCVRARTWLIHGADVHDCVEVVQDLRDARAHNLRVLELLPRGM
jgi:hypothetical protein